MDDYAFLKTDSGQITCGFGPFTELRHPPKDGVAFYVNDFELTHPRPWKVPSRWEAGPTMAPLACNLNGARRPEVEWAKAEQNGFALVFEDIQDRISAGSVVKTVPVFTEHGELVSGDLESLLTAVDHLPATFFSYGYRRGDHGVVGATPELLFALHGRHMETMALAGTSATERVARFMDDAKEIHEHEFVADYLEQKLSALGEVTREARQLLSLGAIAHFLTPIHVDLEDEPDVDALIRLMHPTPALGALPRDGEALDRLAEYRRRMGTPLEFGAPFGLWSDGVFHSVVAIRNLSWKGKDVYLPVGCGVIAESQLECEWRELTLKRRAVKNLLGL